MSNQSKTEPMPPTSAHGGPEPAEGDPPPTVAPGVDHAAMRAGAAPAHAPAHTAAGGEDADEVGDLVLTGAGSPGDPAGVPVVSDTPAPGTSEDAPAVQGVAQGPTGMA